MRAAAAALQAIDWSPSVSLEFGSASLHEEARRCKRAISFDTDFVIAGFSLWEGEP